MFVFLADEDRRIDYVCVNRIVWGADQYTEVRLRHTKGAPDRWLVGRLRPERIIHVRLPPLCCRKPAMRRAACSAEQPHMPRPPSPPALLTAAARAGVLIEPIGA
jgi:hypothetical protein